MEERTAVLFKVFLVEDSPLLRKRVEEMVSAIPGARVVGRAESASEAIEAILASAPDAVVLDLHLKESSGFDVMRAVHKTAPAIAFYVLTNHPVEGYRITAQRLGARGFFDKSSEFEKLRDVLASLAQQGKA